MEPLFVLGRPLFPPERVVARPIAQTAREDARRTRCTDTCISVGAARADLGVDGAPAVKLDSGAAVSDELSSMLLADGSCPIGLTDEEQLVGSALHPV